MALELWTAGDEALRAEVGPAIAAVQRPTFASLVQLLNYQDELLPLAEALEAGQPILELNLRGRLATHREPVAQALELVAQLATVETLDLSFNHELGADELRALRGHPGLRSVWFYGNAELDDEALAQLTTLPRLEELVLRDMPEAVSGAGVAAFARCSSLRRLRLMNGHLPRALDAFGGHPSLAELSVSLAGVAFDVGLLERLPALRELNWCVDPKALSADVVARAVALCETLDAARLWAWNDEDAWFERRA